MTTFQSSARFGGLGLIVLLLAAAGCSGSQQSPLGPMGLQQNGSGVHRMALVSNKVDVTNVYTSTISPTGGSAICWSVSPSWPSVAAGATTGAITLTYNTLCVGNLPSLSVSYAPLSSVSTDYCTFTATYTGSALFTYTVTNHDKTTCKAVPSATTEVNEHYIFDQTAAGLRRHRG